MGALAGFIIGYLLGTKAGPEGVEQLRKSWDGIRRSEEFQGLVATATATAGQVFERVTEGEGNVSDRLRSAIAGETGDAVRRRLQAVK
jgi:hypothetical protein